MKKVLFVCMGNICRSPMAQVVAQKMVADAGKAREFEFDSAGTHASRWGERPDPRAEDALTRRGYKVGRMRSRKIASKDFEQFDLILAMDASNLAELQRLCQPEYLPKLRLLLECSKDLQETDVPDPYYGSAKGFERVLDLCEIGVKGLL